MSLISLTNSSFSSAKSLALIVFLMSSTVDLALEAVALSSETWSSAACKMLPK